MRFPSSLRLLKAVLAALFSAALFTTTWSVAAADWPAFRHDIGRSGSTPEQIGCPLYPQWTHVPRHAPCPAWPEPVREANLMRFDKVFQVVAAGGLAYYGSSADHQVHALDLATGREAWHFFTDAPVRFAPQIDDGKLYVASDDGCVYCLSAADGKLQWKFRGPADERLMGNEAMVSRWPLRGGLVVDGGTVYFTAGMWPTEGVHIYALKAADGSVLWKAESKVGLAPQGYMAANEKLLFAPVGRADAKVIEREGGKVLAGRGMTQAIIQGDLYLTGPYTHAANENLPVAGGPQFPDRRLNIFAWDVRSLQNIRARPRVNFADKEVAATCGDAVYLAGRDRLAAYGLKDLQQKWQIEFPRAFSLAVAGSTLIAGGDGQVALLDHSNGKKLWSGQVEGQVHGLAVAGGRLLASMDNGRITCFGAEKTDQQATVSPHPNPLPEGEGTVGSPHPNPLPEGEGTVGPHPNPLPSGRVRPAGEGTGSAAALAGQILQSTGIKAGLCLLAGVGDGRLALELAKQSDMRIYCAEPDESKAAAARELLDRAGLYGVRVTVHHIDSKTLPYPDYFANLIVVDQAGAGPLAYSADELYRVLRPYGGTAYLISPPGTEALRLHGTDLRESRAAADALKIVRGDLPGAGQWTQLYADAGNSASSGDQLVRSPLKVLWFGKPGPDVMMNRHWRGTAPLFVAGRMFVLGQHDLIALDAYNGRELWSRALPSVARRVVDIWGGSMAGDPENVYVATGDACLRFDAASGAERPPYRLPVARPQFDLASTQTIEMDSLGKVEIRSTPEALLLKLTKVDAAPSAAPAKSDSWELFFDFRPQEERTCLYGPGAFQIIVTPASKDKAEAGWHRGTWSKPPSLGLQGSRTPQGSETEVRIAWSALAKLTGARSPGARAANFNFGVILNSWDEGRRLPRRTFRFANDASYRLANCWADMSAGPPKAATGPAEQPALAVPRAERLEWGNLTVSGDTVLGTIVAAKDTPQVLAHGWDFASEGNDYTGPSVNQVLDIIGLESAAKSVFALNRGDGRPRWIYTPVGAVPMNGIAVGQGRVYLLDKGALLPDAPWPAPKSGQPRVAGRKTTLEVLDLATGKRLWHLEEGLEKEDELRLGHGVLLASHLTGMTAYDADKGAKLWSVSTAQSMHHCSAFLRAPVITGHWIYDEPYAYDLHSGTSRKAASGQPWRWGGASGCGTVSAGENVLFFRSGTPAFQDVAAGSGPSNFLGIRPGCYINMIVAGGMVLMPEASSGCGCPYNFQTTVSLIHAGK